MDNLSLTGSSTWVFTVFGSLRHVLKCECEAQVV